MIKKAEECRRLTSADSKFQRKLNSGNLIQPFWNSHFRTAIVRLPFCRRKATQNCTLNRKQMDRVEELMLHTVGDDGSHATMRNKLFTKTIAVLLDAMAQEKRLIALHFPRANGII